MKKRYFKNWIIDAGFQLRFGLKIALAALLVGIINIVIFNRYMGENYELVIDPFLEAGLLPESAGIDLYSEFYRIQKILIGTTLGFSLLCLFLGIVFSHAIIGPTINFRRVFQKVKEGDTSARVNLRNKDEFKGLAQALNDMLDAILTNNPNDKQPEDQNKLG